MATLSLITKPDAPRAAGSSLSKRERLEKRFASLKALRDPYDQDYDEIERLCLPSRTSMLSSTALKRRANTSKQDTAGVLAGRTLVNGMATGLSSPARPWFKLKTHDPDLNDYEPVKIWLYDTEMKIGNHFSSTNYYDAAKIAYSELAHMGFACTLAVEHSEYGAVYHAFDHGEVWIAEDDGLRVSSMFYKTAYTVDQMVRKFPWDKLSTQVQNAYNQSNIAVLVPVMCAIEKNDDRDADKLDAMNKPWRSTWWEIGNSSKEILLKEGGFDSKPFTAPRWETMGSEVYSSSSPGFAALADLRELEWSARKLGRLKDMLARPPGFFPASLGQTALSMDPGSMNFVNDMQGKPEFIKVDPNAITVSQSDIERLTRRVQQLFYADLWMAVTEMEGVQPRNQQELMYRNEEKLTQLGPVVDRVNIEKLEVDIDRAYQMLSNFNMLMPIPPELKGKPLQIDFVSILAQAQLATSNSAIERAAQFVGYLAGVFPDAALKFDAEQAINAFATNSQTPPKIIRSDEVVAQMKAAAEDRQKAQEAMTQTAPAMVQGAQAAELLSKTRTGTGGSMLDQLMGQ